jgi:MFS transporter, ACS family, D-galactonate transporter
VPSSPTTSPSPRRTVLLLMCVVACGHFNRVGISVAGTERIIPAYGLSAENMGLVYSAFLIFYTLAMFPGGWFIDRFGPRRALVLLGFSSTLFIALTGCVGLVFHHATALLLGLLAIRSLLGTVYAPLHPGSARMVADELPPRERPRALGWINFSACLGIAATQLVLGALIDRFDWQVAILISSAMSLIVALIWMHGTSAKGEPHDQATDRFSVSIDLESLWRVLRQRSVIGITVSYAAYGYFQYLFFYWISYYFETVQHQDRVAARGYTTAITLAMGAGMLCGGWLTSQVPARFSPWARRALVPMLGMLASGAVFELGLLASNPQATIAAFILSAALLGLCEAAFWTTAVELGGPYGGSAAGLMNTGGNAGGAISPYLTPFLSDLIARQSGADAGWRIALALAGVIVFAGGGLWLVVHPPQKEATSNASG